MRIAICEDNQMDLQLVCEVIKMQNAVESEPIELDTYTSGEQLLEKMKQTAYDLLILDIYMEKMSGIEIARKVKEMSYDTEMAFLSSSREFGIEAFEVEALHYMLKPVNAVQIKRLLKRYHEKRGKLSRYIRLSLGKEQIDIKQTTISKIQSERKGIRIYETSGKNRWFRVTFIAVEEQLAQSNFLKISRGYLVNMDYIKDIKGDLCWLEDGSEILLSRKERAEIRRKYYNFLFSHEVERGK